MTLLILLCYAFSAIVTTVGSRTVTVETGTNGATTLSRVNFSGYAGHVTILS